jgi:hypothetical protein
MEFLAAKDLNNLAESSASVMDTGFGVLKDIVQV